MKDRVTMAMIAARAGVHPTTVSLALRNHPSLPPATRERLQALAKEMGYEPDPALASLVAYRKQLRPAKTRQTLAYVTNWDTPTAWKKMRAHARFHAGALARAESLGFDLEHFWLGEEGLRPERLSQMLETRGIRGIVIASHQWGTDHFLRFDWPRFAAVKIDFIPHEPALHSVTNDQRAIIQLAVQRAVAAGYRRIGCVMPDRWDDFVDRAWSAGFLAEQQRLAPADRVPLLIYPDPKNEKLVPRKLFESWYHKHKPEVIVSFEIFVKPRLAEMSLEVPRDVAYVETFLDPGDGLTAGVRQNCHRVGELAVEILVGQLQQYNYGLPEFATATLVEGTWFDGASLPKRA